MSHGPHYYRNHLIDGFVIAIRLPASEVYQCVNNGCFWPTVEMHGDVVDSLPRGSRETFSILLDYLVCEVRIQMPQCWPADQDLIISLPAGVDILTCLSRHDTRVLRTRMRKRELFDLKNPTGIFSAYDRAFEQLSELCLATLMFFDRLPDQNISDDERLLVVTVPQV